MTPRNGPRTGPRENKLPRTLGGYILLFQLPRCDRLTIGRLGTFDLVPGHYAYVGSALAGLESRVGRHLRGGGKKHWHIDHLVEQASDRTAFLIPSSGDIECALAEMIRELPGATMPIKGFGSSDCHCCSHLFLLQQGTFDAFQAQMKDRGAKMVTSESLGPGGSKRAPSG